MDPYYEEKEALVRNLLNQQLSEDDRSYYISLLRREGIQSPKEYFDRQVEEFIKHVAQKTGSTDVRELGALRGELQGWIVASLPDDNPKRER